MRFNDFSYSHDILRNLYRPLVISRLIEEKMLLLLRQGKISKWFSGIGQEAISVGVTMALREKDTLLPLHRNLGVFTSRNVPLKKLFAQWQGKRTGFTKGRDRTFHFGAPEHRIIGMISHLGAMLGVADGIALAEKIKGDNNVVAVFSGDGGTSEGDFHEAVNVAAVWDLPVLFVLEHNGWGLSTPNSSQFKCRQLIEKAVGYGIEGIKVDGNNVVEVYDAVRTITERMRVNRKPVLLETVTMRMRGHEEASGIKYVPKDLLDEWATRDPLDRYRDFLIETDVFTERELEDLHDEIKRLIDEAWDSAMEDPEPTSDMSAELNDVYAPVLFTESPPNRTRTKKKFVNAISDALRLALEQHPDLIFMGQDIAEYGGVFKVTEGLVHQFGADRIRNTPLCESAILGASLGLSIAGHRSMVEMQFADFVSCGFNQIVNNLAKTYYRWGQPVRVVVRMPTGAGAAAGPFHSQSTEAWFCHVPGLKVVYPSNSYDAKGLLLASFEEENPVLFFEHKFLYRSSEQEIPDGYYTLPIGKASMVREGTDLTIVTYGICVPWSMEIQKQLPHLSMEIIDLRSLSPWDRETVFASVRKTGRCLVAHEDVLTGGFGGEIASVIQQEMFRSLDAPVMRVGGMDTPIPFHPTLEQQFLPRHRLQEAIVALASY